MIEKNPFLKNLKDNNSKSFYGQRQKYTDIETLGKIKKSVIQIDKNDSAEIFNLKILIL